MNIIFFAETGVTALVFVPELNCNQEVLLCSFHFGCICYKTDMFILHLLYHWQHAGFKYPFARWAEACLGSHLSSLRDELRGVELGDHALEHLVDDGGQDSLLVVQAQALVHAGQLRGVGAGEDAQGDVHHLQV